MANNNNSHSFPHRSLRGSKGLLFGVIMGPSREVIKSLLLQAYELSTLTGTQVMLLVASETGHVYTFATRKLQPMITSEAGK
ncbi:hypothetical protein NQ318_013220 [Aromia moschata]|uniref:Serum response factor homolog n=1 Tax=Aromia moschata TaxID=1265417 RepID=A0AAV8YAZ2_9CUCU|nr:hypothetical protein NQ318_013220 [Aromia moschata]